MRGASRRRAARRRDWARTRLASASPAPGGPLILDFGTSATAEGKVRVKRIAGQLCPDGWLLDCEGRPTNDPDTLYGNPPGTILPMGGEQAYKGFGLGLMVEIFAGALSGGVCIREVPINQNGNCVFMMVLDPGHLGGAEHFAREVAGLAEFVRGCPTIEGVSEILLPGDPERRMLRRTCAQGIPLDDGNWNELVKLAARARSVAAQVNQSGVRQGHPRGQRRQFFVRRPRATDACAHAIDDALDVSLRALEP